MEVKYRSWHNVPPLKQIKLEIPGWSGEHRERSNGCTAQPWHCIPFVEGSTYGLELKYQFKTEVAVVNDGQTVKFIPQKDGKEVEWTEYDKLPFAHFAPKKMGGHYGFTSSYDIKAPEGHVVRLEPHPRFFTDETGTCPIVVPGHIHPWWSRIFFVVFKAPLPGETHIFRHGEPYGQVLIVPAKTKYEIQEMSAAEKNERATIEKKISMFTYQIGKHSWNDNVGNNFNDKYKQMQIIYNKGGMDALYELFNSLNLEQKAQNNAKKMGKFIKTDTLQGKQKHSSSSDAVGGSEGYPAETNAAL